MFIECNAQLTIDPEKHPISSIHIFEYEFGNNFDGNRRYDIRSEF
jgi:hypothetical protein